MMESLASSIR